MIGICIAPLNPTAQIVISIVTPVWLLAVLSTIAMIQWCISRVECLRSCQLRLFWDWSGYQRTAIDLYLFSYSTVATTLVSYMICTEARGESVIFDYPGVNCDTSQYRTGLAVVVLVFISTIVLLPMLSLCFLFRRRHRLDLYRARCGTLFEAFTESNYFWQVILVVRRSAFIALNLGLATRPAWRFLTFACLHGISLVVHILWRPYREETLNRFESLTFITLATIAIVLNAFPDPERATDIKYGINQTTLSIIITILILIPITVFAVYALVKIYHRFCTDDSYRHRLLSNHHKGTVTIVDDGRVNGVSSESLSAQRATFSMKFLADDEQSS
jgi:hypothetical protein